MIPAAQIPGVRRMVPGQPLYQRIHDAAHNQRVIEAAYARSSAVPSPQAAEDPRTPGAVPAACEFSPTRADVPGVRATVSTAQGISR
jgi:hypothetical protein